MQYTLLRILASLNHITIVGDDDQIVIKECHNKDAQCASVVDKILEATSDQSDVKCSFGNIAILYRRQVKCTFPSFNVNEGKYLVLVELQVSGKVFQTAFRERKIPFNVHGVSVYRKKVVRAIIAMLRTTFPGFDDGSYRRVFKALLPFEKEEKKKVIDYIDKISTARKFSFISAAGEIFSAKVSGNLKRKTPNAFCHSTAFECSNKEFTSKQLTT